MGPIGGHRPALVGAPPRQPLPERAPLQLAWSARWTWPARWNIGDRPAARPGEAGGSAAVAVDDEGGGPSYSARPSRPSCVSVAGGAEPVDDTLWDAPAR